MQVFLATVTLAVGYAILADEGAAVDYIVKLTTVTRGWDGNKCWVHSRAGANASGHPWANNSVIKGSSVVHSPWLDRRV